MTMAKKIVVKRYQWERNVEGGQTFGNRMEIRLLDDTAFRKIILPKLRPKFANSLTEYQSKLPDVTHYAVIWRDGDTGWQFVAVGSLDELQEQPGNSIWAREVEQFDSPEALAFGKTADSIPSV